MELVIQMARENPSWGYDRIAGALANLGHVVSDQTVGNILRRHGIPPAAKRIANTNWKDFIAAHLAVLTGVDFFTVEALTWRGLATYYVLFFLHLEARRVNLAGITRHPTAMWMEQMARNAVDEASERNHQGKGNILLFPLTEPRERSSRSTVCCRQRLGGMLNYHSRAA